MKRTFEVSILGQKFGIKSEADDEYVQNVAKYVDEKIHEVTQGKSGASLNLVLLAAMNIADDLFRMRESMSGKIKLVENKLSNMLKLIEEEGKI